VDQDVDVEETSDGLFMTMHIPDEREAARAEFADVLTRLASTSPISDRQTRAATGI
jgi:hypothetical protein